MITVIMAGGKGTRLLELTKDELPKPMLPVGGKPILQWQIECLRSNGLIDICIIIGHLGEKIQDYFGDGSSFGVSISYFVEDTPLGTAGALAFIKERIQGDYFLLVYGDTIFDIDISRMEAYHQQKKSTATLFVHPNSHPYDSDLVILDSDNHMVGFDSKTNTRTYWYSNMVNAGFYILSRKICDTIDENSKTDLEKDILFKNCGKYTGIYGYVSSEYIKDAGTKDRIERVEKDILSGAVAAKKLSKPQKCVFLDRDGVLNKHIGLLHKPEQLELEDTAVEAVSILNTSKYLTIVITNQPVVARGLCSEEKVDEIHMKLQTLLGRSHVYLDDIFYCPHHPDKGYPEENPDYKINCECRKPKTGMLKAAAAKYRIDLTKSWFIGDTTVDIKTGKDAGIKTILVGTGEAGKDGKYNVEPDYITDNILTAVEHIMRN
jgi:histidinol-phosphate phosphatase family protein